MDRSPVVVITGASGLVGGRLRAALRARGAELRLVSRRARAAEHDGESWVTWDDLATALDGADAVVHLAGEPIVGSRWNDKVKRELRDSRVGTTKQLVAALREVERRPATLVQASAVGWYGDRGDEVLAEDAGIGEGFLPELCREWEVAGHAAEAHGLRVVLLRFGIVLDPAGGALKQMLPPFKFGVGGRLGSGEQWMPWIHHADLVDLLLKSLDDASWAGAYNAVAPEPVRNVDFTKALGRTLRRPTVLPVPAFALRILFGEGAQVLLNSQRAVPAAAQAAGWQPRYADLDAALADLLG